MTKQEKKVGRPSKFTPETRKLILKLIRRGMPLTHAAHAVGMSFPTFQNHRHANPDFDSEIEEARARGIAARLRVIHDATHSADESVRLRAATWFLEHVAPEHFARNRVEVTGKDGEPLAAAIAVYLPQKGGDAGGRPLVPVKPQTMLTNGDDWVS